jgi:hypothetical protein
MTDNDDRSSSPAAATPQPYWGGFNDRAASEKDSANNQCARPLAKKPYRKPTYRFERVFETMALSCGKISVTQFQCRFHRHTS